MTLKDVELVSFFITGILSIKPFNLSPAQELQRLYLFGKNIHLYINDYGFNTDQYIEYLQIFLNTYCSEIIKFYSETSCDFDLMIAQLSVLFPAEFAKRYLEMYHLMCLYNIYSYDKNNNIAVIKELLRGVVNSIIGVLNEMFVCRE